jgi:hypothetical protein
MRWRLIIREILDIPTDHDRLEVFHGSLKNQLVHYHHAVKIIKIEIDIASHLLNRYSLPNKF